VAEILRQNLARPALDVDALSRAGAAVVQQLQTAGIQVPADVRFEAQPLKTRGRHLRELTRWDADTRTVRVAPELLKPEHRAVLAGTLAQQLAKIYGEDLQPGELYQFGRDVVGRLGLPVSEYAASQRLKIGVVSAYTTEGGLREYVNHVLNGYGAMIQDGILEVEVFGHTTDALDPGDVKAGMKVIGEDKATGKIIIELPAVDTRQVTVTLADGSKVKVPVRINRVTRFNDSTSIERIGRAVAERGVDIVNFQWLLSSAAVKPTGILASLAPVAVEKMAGVPTTVTMHHTVHTMDLEAGQKVPTGRGVGAIIKKTMVLGGSELIERTLQLVSQVYVLLDRYIDAYRSYGVSPRRMHHGLFQQKPAIPRRDDKVFIGSVGKWGDYKLVEDQVAGLRAMFRQRPELRGKALGLLGGGDNPNAKGYTKRMIEYYRSHPEDGVLVIAAAEVEAAERPRPRQDGRALAAPRR
jgi:glycosyltransferase involved in cell wall biosynthesis